MTAGSVRKVVGQKADTIDSSAAAEYREICPATKYPLLCDSREAPLAFGPSWYDPRVTGDAKAAS